MGELFAVVSGKGGTGKTSVCAALATALAKEGKRVLCIDCDVGLRNLDISLGLSECGALSFLGRLRGGLLPGGRFPAPGLPRPRVSDRPMNCPVEKINTAAFGEMLSRARQLYDYVFLDAPAGVDAGFRLTAQFADRLLLVTGAGPAAVRDASRVGDLLELMGKKNIRLIVNRVDKSMLGTVCLTIDDVMDAADCPCGNRPGGSPCDPRGILRSESSSLFPQLQGGKSQPQNCQTHSGLPRTDRPPLITDTYTIKE